MLVLAQVHVFSWRGEQIRCELGTKFENETRCDEKDIRIQYLSPAPSMETEVVSISKGPYHVNRTVLNVVVKWLVA